MTEETDTLNQSLRNTVAAGAKTMNHFQEAPLDILKYQGGFSVETADGHYTRVARRFTDRPKDYPEYTLFQADAQVVTRQRAIAQVYIRGANSAESVVGFTSIIIAVDSQDGSISGGEPYGISNKTHTFNAEAFATLMIAPVSDVALLNAEDPTKAIFVPKPQA